MVNKRPRITPFELQGHSLEEAAKALTKLLEKFGPDAYINLGEAYAELWYESPETEDEKKDRIYWEKRGVSARKAKYEELKKEFGE